MTTLLPAPSSVADYRPPQPPLNAVPSLAWISLSILYLHPEQVHQIPYRLNYRPELNVIQDALDMDPRMWATLVQLYDNLPEYMKTFAIPLRDSHMPKLQSIPCTSHFSMITVLEAPACRTLCDDNIAELKGLSTLVALDASETRLTSHGVKAFASTLQNAAGPWALRVLDMRACLGITTDVYDHLSKFPLLSVVDLRGTRCSRRIPPPPGFSANGNPLFFHPTKLSESLARLREVKRSMYSSPSVYTLLVSAYNHPKRPPTTGLVSHDNSVVTIVDDNLFLDNGNAIARRVEAREEHLRHEENSAAWHRRRELLELTEVESEKLSHPPTVRKKALVTPQSNTMAGPSRLPPTAHIPRPLSKGLLSGFQCTPLARPSIARSSRIVSTDVWASRPIGPDLPSSRTSSTLSSAPTRSTQRTEHRLPPNSQRSHPNSYGASLPSGFRSTPLTTRHNARSGPTKRPTSSTSRLGVQAPPRPEPSVTEARTWVNPDEEPFMLYRDPPPWSALEEAKCILRMQEAKRRGEVKQNVAMRASGVAHVDWSGKKAAAAKLQIGNLLAKRTEMRQTFGLSKAASTSGPRMTTCTPLPSTNPFKKRAVVPSDKPVADGSQSTQATPSGKGSERKLIPISKVPKPVFTQDLLDASSKENRKASLGSDGAGGSEFAAKNQKRSSRFSSVPHTTCTSKQRPPGAGNLRNWLITK